jgi:hypothetical protein
LPKLVIWFPPLCLDLMMNKNTRRTRMTGAAMTSALVQKPVFWGSVVKGMSASVRTSAMS